MNAMPQAVSSEWYGLFDQYKSCRPSTYKSLDALDNIPSLSFLKDLFWQEIRTWIQNDTNPISLITHPDLEGPGRVYLGGMNHALNDQLLEANAISAVITIHPADLLAWDNRDPSYGLRRYRTEGCPVQHHLMVPLEDNVSSNLIDYFDDTYAFIREHLASGHNILIHCKSGRSRSVAVLIAYLQRRHYETTVRPLGLAVDQAWERMRGYREDITDIIRRQRLPVIIILERFLPLLRLYELQLVGHPGYEIERKILFPDPVERQNGHGTGHEVDVKGGAAVLKICIAIVFFKNNQKPLESIVQRLFELNEAYFYELEGSEFSGRSYVHSQHAHRGLLKFYAQFAREYKIAIPHAVSSLVRLASDGKQNA
jgi:hypothetical protein